MTALVEHLPEKLSPSLTDSDTPKNVQQPPFPIPLPRRILASSPEFIRSGGNRESPFHLDRPLPICTHTA